MRRLASTVTRPVRRRRRSPRRRRRARSSPSSSSSSVDPERAHPVDERRVRRPDRGELEAAPRLLGGGAGVGHEQVGDGVRGQLVELVDGADRGGDVGQAEPAVEALDQLAVVELEAQRRERQRVERVDHHPHHLDVVVERQLVAPDDVDVGLGELAVAALLRPLAAPGRLDLVAAERELQVPGVLEHVARERHGEVEVQAELLPASPSSVVGLQPAQDVDLLVDLAALGEPVERLDDPGLDVGEAVQLEGARQRRDDLALDDALGRQQLGEPAQRVDLGAMRASQSSGDSTCAPESPSLGARAGRGWWRARGRWSSGRRGRGAPRCRRRGAAPSSARLRSIVGWSPPGRSVRPIEPANSRSPENITSETSLARRTACGR